MLVPTDGEKFGLETQRKCFMATILLKESEQPMLMKKLMKHNIDIDEYPSECLIFMDLVCIFRC